MSGDPLFNPTSPDNTASNPGDASAELYEATLAAFTSPAGATWLARMEQQLVQAASYVPGMDAAHVAWCEGKRSLVLEIKGEMQLALGNRLRQAAARLPQQPAEG